MRVIEWFFSGYYWVLLVLSVYGVVGYLSHQTQQHGGWWGYALYAMGFVAAWPLVSHYCPDGQLVFRGMLYDFLMAVGFLVVVIYLQPDAHWRWYNWCGVAMVLAGMAVMKIEG